MLGSVGFQVAGVIERSAPKSKRSWESKNAKLWFAYSKRSDMSLCIYRHLTCQEFSAVTGSAGGFKGARRKVGDVHRR